MDTVKKIRLKPEPKYLSCDPKWDVDKGFILKIHIRTECFVLICYCYRYR